MRAYVGLGANLGDPAAQVGEAIGRMGRLTGVVVAARSALYRSAPLGPGAQPDYVNAVVAIEVRRGPWALLGALHDIERDMGRERPPERWAPRIIDLDLLHVERMKMTSACLTLPHPELHRRNFVVVPLAEVAPGLDIPGHGPVGGLCRTLGTAGLVRHDGAQGR